MEGCGASEDKLNRRQALLIVTCVDQYGVHNDDIEAEQEDKTDQARGPKFDCLIFAVFDLLLAVLHDDFLVLSLLSAPGVSDSLASCSLHSESCFLFRQRSLLFCSALQSSASSVTGAVACSVLLLCIASSLALRVHNKHLG